MKKLLVIGYVWPEPNSSAAGTRMLQLINIFQKQNYSVTYASPAVLSEHMVDLEALNIKQASIELNNSSFDSFVEVLNPDVVLFDRFMMEEQFSWRVDKVCPNAIKILEIVDLHCLRDARHQTLKNNISPYDLNNLDFHTDIAVREVASILRCDLSIIISEVEVEILVNKYNVNKNILIYIPFMYQSLEPEASIQQWPDYSERQHFMTIGNFRHAPNWDSVLYLKNSLWPKIRSHLKNVECHIYGSYPPKKAQQLHNPKQGFYIKGWAENALDTLAQYRVCLAPLRFGAGMKGKLADAMLSGTPNITTSIGAESMYSDYEWPGYVSDNDESLISQTIELYRNESIWREKQSYIFPIVNNVFNQESNEIKLIEKFKEIEVSLEKHRNRHFTGKMLRHHTLKSAMYMSQWIEAKNKFKN